MSDEQNENLFIGASVYQPENRINDYIGILMGSFLNPVVRDQLSNRNMDILMNILGDVIMNEYTDEEEKMMEIATEESLNYYNTQEKKPNIKLGIKSDLWKDVFKDEICSICGDQCNKGELKVIETPCKHIFHENCIAEWVQYKPECPVCRKNIPTYEETK